MIKLKARKGTSNMKKCAFCAYWGGNADVEYDYGKMKRRANDSCPYFCLDSRYS